MDTPLFDLSKKICYNINILKKKEVYYGALGYVCLL